MRIDWNTIEWKLDGTDNDLVRKFLEDETNVHNCMVCPYKQKHTGYDQLPCGQYHCWVELSC